MNLGLNKYNILGAEEECERIFLDIDRNKSGFIDYTGIYKVRIRIFDV